MIGWSPSGCQVWVRFFFWWRQCPQHPILAKESILLCHKHKALDVVGGTVNMKWYRFGIPSIRH